MIGMTTRSTSICAIVVFAFAAMATAGPARNPATLPAVEIASGGATTILRVADLDAAESEAWGELMTVAADGTLQSTFEAGYTVTNRVVVRTAVPDSVAALAVVDDVTDVTPLEGVSDYWIVTTPTVATAVDTAASLRADGRYELAYVDVWQPRELRSPTDPGYPNQWHLNNDDDPLYDVNVEASWAAGVDGSGVVIGILEGGWQYDHPDLAANYYAAATQHGGSATGHGTSCAGVAAAVAYNGAGGVGVAYGAQISGQIYGTGSQTASAFAFRNDLNDIKSNSWGPSDNGRVSTMTPAEYTALEESVLTGRDGLGVVVVWAAGNGGLADRVEYDPYASSRYALAIGSVGDEDTRAYYNETGSSMFMVAQSSGNDRRIYTTTSGSGYTSYFGGTSSASPLAAGVIALLLQVNPDLSWRDVQHVLLNSGRQCDPTDGDWEFNAAGHLINYNYGFGAIDANAAVALAEIWQPVRQETQLSSGVVAVDEVVPTDDVGLVRTVTIDQDIRIESVELVLNVDATRVGDIGITLTAPSGTESVLAVSRSDVGSDYVDYIFTSLRHWDELSAGEWTVQLTDANVAYPVTWEDFEIRVYGTRRSGDLNCDGVLSAADIDPFVFVLTQGADAYAAQWPDCDATLADINGDGVVTPADIDPFVQVLLGD
jgi:subtilisin family serine protease